MRFASKNLAVFYYQLGTLIQAGLPIQSALASARKTAPRSMRRVVAGLSAIVNEGTSLHEAMERCGKRFAPLDEHSISMTERSGALDIGLLSLSKYYENRASARRKFISGILYPGFLLTASVFILHFPALFLGMLGGKPYTMLDYLWDTAGTLIGLAVAVWLISLLMRRLFTVPKLNVALDRLLLAVPVFGRLRLDYALSQWVSSIRLMLRAGIGVVPALEAASRTVPSPLIADAYQKVAPLIGSQLDVSQALATTGVFPDYLIQLWATGEKSGRMDEMLERLAAFYEERWCHTLDQTVIWLPRIAYALVAAFMVYQIFKAFNTYLGAYNTILGD